MAAPGSSDDSAVNVSQPAMRADLIGMLELILDRHEVHRAWIAHDPESGLLQGGWLPGHVLNQIDDDAHLGDPASMLGVTLRCDEEVALVELLDPAVEAVPCDCSDTETVNSPEWAAMLPAAATLLAELLRNDRSAPTGPNPYG